MLAIEIWITTLLVGGLTLLLSLLRSPRLRQFLLAGRRPPSPPWTGTDLLLVAALTVLGLGAIQASLQVLDGNLGGAAWRAAPFLQLVIGVVSLDGLGALVVYAVVRRRSPSPMRALGLMSAHSARDTVRGGLAYGAALPALFAFLALWSWFLQSRGVKIPPQPVVQILMAKQHWLLIAASTAMALALVPFLEEVIFRGFMLPLLGARVRPTLAILLTAAFFGLLHDWPYSGPTFAVGVLLGWLYWRTGSLWVSIGCHAAFNAVALVAAWLASS